MRGRAKATRSPPWCGLPATSAPTTCRGATGAEIERLAFAPAPRLLVWVAEAEDRLVGTLVGAPTFSTWRGQEGLYVVDLYVETGLRGMRLGERLIAAAAVECLDAGLSFLKLETTDANAGARRFYQRLGFRPVLSETVFALEREAVEALGRTVHGGTRLKSHGFGLRVLRRYASEAGQGPRLAL